MTIEFTHLSLHPQLVQAVIEQGYEQPTPIQAAVIPLMIAGKDVIGQAQTGTGKTAAFALPMLNNLQAGSRHVQGLVVVPTRELALQVAKAVHTYGRNLDVSVLPVYGGQAYGRQINRLERGVDVVVGTPGRLLDLIKKKVLKLDHTRLVVLDEADEMLSMGFIEDIEAILEVTPSERQTALFSATLPPAIRRLGNSYMKNPESVLIEREQMTVGSIEQRYVLVNAGDKLAALTRLFEMETITSALIFVRTRLGTGKLANELTLRGFPAEALSGELSQDMREQVMGRFRRNQITVLVATDVAARGLDIDDISHVFNYDLPEDPEIYVHRVGRTGRAGKSGIAYSLVTPKEQGRLRRIEAFARTKIKSSGLPTEEDIHRHREEQLLEQVKVWLLRGRCKRERELVEELVEGGYDALEIAAVALKLARAEEKQRPILPLGELQVVARRRNKPISVSERRGRKPGRNRTHEKGMIRLVLSKGRAHGVRPADVVGTIAHHAEIPGNTIGKIDIRDQHTLVDVPEKFIAQVLENEDNYRIRRQPIQVVVG